MIWKKDILQSDFNRNVVKLFVGTTVAQAIPIAIAPILTRLYGPEEFGVFALFFSVTNLLGIVACGRYELAIVLPDKDEDADQLEKLCYVLSFLFALLLLIPILAFREELNKWLGGSGSNNWLFFVPVSVFLTGIIQTLSFKSNRRKNFTKISYLKISQTTTTALVNISFGILKTIRNSLIVGQVAGQFIAITLFQISKGPSTRIDAKRIWSLARRYKNFILYNAPTSLLNTAASSLPIFYLSGSLGRENAGFYGLVERSIGAPISLISYSVSQVLLEDIASRSRQNLPIRGRLLRLLKNSALIGLIPFGTLFFFAEDIFSFVFGHEWREAGKYASILSIAFFMRFSVSPLSVVFISLNSLRWLMIWQVSYFFTTFAVTLYSAYSKDVILFLILISSNDVLLYSIYLLLILNIAKK
ncbi:MAG TPA: lipopolysaccharide biosynthesis protein [Cyclobacteriaceae bacterium]|nr:lipopolysaccharide biosynthesis protein [Cyclobacteriaceae bacterium]